MFDSGEHEGPRLQGQGLGRTLGAISATLLTGLLFHSEILISEDAKQKTFQDGKSRAWQVPCLERGPC